jgi:hypothetical protein
MAQDGTQAWGPGGDGWPEAGSSMTALVNLLLCVCALTEPARAAEVPTFNEAAGALRGGLPAHLMGLPSGEAPQLRFVRFATAWPEAAAAGG